MATLEIDQIAPQAKKQTATTKTDVVFIQQYPMTYFGIIALDGNLKKAGYRVDILIDALEEDLISELRSLNPKLVGFSVFSTEHQWLIRITKKIRLALPNVSMVVGGIHAMVYPEGVLADTSANLSCYGDGEDVLINIIKELDKPTPKWSSVQGIAYKQKDGCIRKNEKGALYQYTDEIVEKRDLYFDRYPIMKEDSISYFISSRGCPFDCSFCYNAYLIDRFGRVGYLRRKSVNNFIEEILLSLKHTKPTSLFFIDDLFTYNIKWLKEFLPVYKEKIGIPFVCMTRAKVLKEEAAELLAEAGCQAVSFGIETGNVELRKTILEKDLTNEDLINCGKMLKKNGITVRASSMFCLPDETVDDALETVELNIKSQVELAASMLLIPYPDTGITDYIKKKGYLPDDFSLSDLPNLAYSVSLLNIPDKKKIKNVHFLFYFFVRYPWTFKAFKKLVYIEWLNPLFYQFFILGCFLRNKAESDLSWGKALVYAWRKRSLLAD